MDIVDDNHDDAPFSMEGSVLLTHATRAVVSSSSNSDDDGSLASFSNYYVLSAAILGVVAIFCFIAMWWMRKTRGVSSSSSPRPDYTAQMRLARERAQADAQEDIIREKQRRQEKAAAATADEKQKLLTRTGVEFPGSGRKLGSGEPKSEADMHPRRPEAGMDTYVPFTSDHTDRGYRPTRHYPFQA